MTTHPTTHLDWPFLDASHRALAEQAARWVATQAIDDTDPDTACRAWVRALGQAGFLRHAVPAPWGGLHESIASRDLCVLRETLAAHHALADFAFAMQGLGAGALALAGDEALKQAWLPKVASGEAIAAFALSEPTAGSDAAALTMRATRVGDGWRLDGEKVWISNGGIADFYCVFARSDDAAAPAKGITGFLVPATTPGLRIAERIEVISPHPLARLAFEGCASPWRSRRRVRPRHAHARHLSRLRRRRGGRLRTPRAP
jgi:acyl-CoA dehydrogenase